MYSLYAHKREKLGFSVSGSAKVYSYKDDFNRDQKMVSNIYKYIYIYIYRVNVKKNPGLAAFWPILVLKNLNNMANSIIEHYF